MTTNSDDARASAAAISAALRDPSLVEELAATEHERWAHWQRYLHEQCEPQANGSLLIPAELVARWTDQMNTPYAKLSAKEQASDREQVDAYVEVLEGWFTDTAPSLPEEDQTRA